jgi:hypothetical protein
VNRRRDHHDQQHHGPRVTPGAHRRARSAGLDPFQCEHELADAIVTLLIACSRYGNSDEQARDTAERFATLQHVTVLVAHEVAGRVRDLRGEDAAAAFRRALGRRRLP